MPPRDKTYLDDPEARTRIVRRIFAAIPEWYDFLNRLLSLRQDVRWRRRAVSEMRFGQTKRFLDVATGTADLAIMAALAHPEITVKAIDFVPEMLGPGLRKVNRAGLANRVTLKEGDATRLDFEDHSFDVSAIAFGIRNIPDRVLALREMSRVVIPGGQVMVLELTTPQGRLMRGLYGLYLNGLLPLIGRLFSGSPEAYRYLADSIMHYPSPREFSRLMTEEAGLTEVRCIPLTLGAAHLHIGLTTGHNG